MGDRILWGCLECQTVIWTSKWVPPAHEKSDVDECPNCGNWSEGFVEVPK